MNPTPPTHGPTCVGIDNGCADCQALEAYSRETSIHTPEALKTAIENARADGGGRIQLGPVIDLRADTSTHVPMSEQPSGGTIDRDALLDLLRRVRCYAVVDPIGNPEAIAPHRMLGVERDIDTALDDTPRRPPRHPAPAKLDEWRSEANRWYRTVHLEKHLSQYPDAFVAPFEKAESLNALQTACERLLDTIDEISILRTECHRIGRDRERLQALIELRDLETDGDNAGELSERLDSIEHDVGNMGASLVMIGRRVDELSPEGSPSITAAIRRALQPLARTSTNALPPIELIVPTDADLNRWRDAADHLPGPIGRALIIMVAEILRLRAIPAVGELAQSRAENVELQSELAAAKAWRRSSEASGD